jgi:hypothetical protein
MDFIERLFGISPDGGSGSLELLLFLAPVVAVLLAHSILKRVGASISGPRRLPLGLRVPSLRSRLARDARRRHLDRA